MILICRHIVLMTWNWRIVTSPAMKKSMHLVDELLRQGVLQSPMGARQSSMGTRHGPIVVLWPKSKSALRRMWMNRRRNSATLPTRVLPVATLSEAVGRTATVPTAAAVSIQYVSLMVSAPCHRKSGATTRLISTRGNMCPARTTTTARTTVLATNSAPTTTTAVHLGLVPIRQ